MLQIFMNNNETYREHISDAILDNLYFGMGMELNRLQSYYRDSDRTIKRPNMLITLLNTLKIDLLNNDVDDMLEKLTSDSVYVSNHVGIASNLSKGMVTNSVIVPDCNEVFMYVTRYDKYQIEDIDISSESVIRPVYSTIDSLLLCHPTNIRNVNNMEDLIVYEIDVITLGLQYYYWARDEMYMDNDIDIGRFLYTVVFVNMMESMLNISLLNRYLNKMDNTLKDVDNDNIYNPITISKVVTRIDKRIDYLIKNIYKKRTKVSYDYFLKSISLLDSDGYKTLQFTDRIYTSNNEWVYWLSRVHYMRHIIDITGVHSLPANKSFTSNIKTDVRLLHRSKALDKIPDMYYKSYIEDEIKNIIKLIGR